MAILHYKDNTLSDSSDNKKALFRYDIHDTRHNTHTDKMNATATENPHVHQNQHEIQKALSNYDTSFLSDDEEDLCPLCIEPLDVMDKHFKPCPCGYQICQFCYNNIRQNPELNGRCPACRRKYDDESVEYIVLSPEELKMERSKQARKERDRKQRERERRENDTHNRKQLAGMRVIQKNLVYVIGLNPPYPYEELPSILRSDKYFGQYGKINKIVINKKTGHEHHSVSNSSSHINSGYGIYVTFSRKDDAAKCIQAIDGIYIDGHQVKAAYGTTKYCSSYLRGQPCPNPNCMFLHEPGEEADAFNNARKEHARHSHAPPTLAKPSTSASSTPKLAHASLRTDDSTVPAAATSSSKQTAPVLTPAPVPSGSNPWGISQAPTPVSTIFNKTSTSTTFPTLSSSLGETLNSPGPGTPTTTGSAPTANSSSNVSSKKKGEKTYEDPYDPMATCVKFLDQTFKFLSDIPERSYTFNSNLLDDETYQSYPSLFSFEKIGCSEQSEGVLGAKLCDLLTIKPVDHMSSLLPFIQNKATPTMLPPGIAVQQPQLVQQQKQQLQQQQLQQQQQQLSLQMQLQAQQGMAQQGMAQQVMSQPQSNSSDLLNQLIHGKKQTAAV